MAPVAIVAGAVRGTGSVVAVRLAEAGWDVAVLCADGAGNADTVHRVRAVGRRALAVETDVTDAVSVQAALDRVCAELGDPGVLVNSVGVIACGAPGEASEEDWNAVVGRSLRGLFVTSRAVTDLMIRQGRGRIVTIANLLGPAEGGPHDHATVLAGMAGFTRTVALELRAFDITVNAVAPAPPVVGMQAPAAPTAADPEGSRCATQAAEAVLFLVGGGASSVTGQTVQVGDEEAAA
uniref:Putative 3-keto-acyl-reductase SimD3 n=1 Tax=Streptomyces antibioticus TaxID=1890 RepID=Q9F5J6_STRAT|nr:SimK [Streptomyces antibioticus]AAK06802.1 putative 3-keto-acyl-reductase SimD3 [Streptomyces antibioticus]AAL15598.1 SimK [Streptomyces antibioticus]